MKKQHFLLLSLLIFALSSCKNYYYFPTSQNVMNFEKKNDISLKVAGTLNQGHFHAGYAFTNKLGFISSLNTFRMPLTLNEYEENKDNAYIWDNEIVLFNNVNDKIFPAINVGFSYGNLANNIEYFDLDMYRYFIQPSLGYRYEFVEFALSSRLSKVDYNLIHQKAFTSDTGENLYEFYDLRDIGKKDFYFLEPAVTLGFVYENFKLRYQIINTLKLNSGNIYYKKTAQMLSLDITINLDELSKK